MSEFLDYWFQGFEKGMQCLNTTDRTKIWVECAKACSNSYSLNIYKIARENASDIADFFEHLKSRIPEIRICEVEKGKSYEIHYLKCLCDLHTEGYINCAMLCECSRQSLLYNLASVYPEKEFEVQIRESILRGNNKCILHINVV